MQVILNNHCAFYAVVARSLHISTCHFGHRQVSEFGRAGELLVTTLKQAASTGRQVSSAQTKWMNVNQLQTSVNIHKHSKNIDAM